MSSLLSRIANRAPFRRTPILRPKAVLEQPLPSIVDEEVCYKGTDILNYTRQEYKSSLNQDNRWSLFMENSSNYAPAGSIMTIYYKESLTGRDSKFTGFMLSLRRHTSNPTIILRSIIEDVGVEQVFNVFSPLISKIECTRKATCLYGRKAYWIRDNPKWVSRFFTTPDQKVTIKKVRARNRVLREQQEKELEGKKKVEVSVPKKLTKKEWRKKTKRFN